jgi:lysozyme family protein
MADFKTSFALLEIDEGGYTVDEGGQTYRGISRLNWPSWPGWKIFDALPAGTLQQGVILTGLPDLDGAIADFYRQNFWRFDALPNQAVADKIFSLTVNLMHAGTRIVQVALNRIQVGPLVADGNWGPRTEAAVIAASPDALLHGIRYFQVKHYLANDAGRPNELDGLLWRAVE